MTMHLQHDSRAQDIDGSGRRGGDLHARIRAEFQEMPGLRLTLPQASRLFALEPALCQRVLGALVDVGTLRIDEGSFAGAAAVRRPV